MDTNSKTNEQGQLKRTLKARHMNMIAIGGSIGTGLFFASGSAVSTAGPGGAVLAYVIMGILVYFLMTSLGEMATLLPISGSFETYATRFIDPALGFTLGWNYWFCWAICVAAELVAGSMIVKFWLPNTNTTLWSMLFLVIIFILNILSARIYGESEYWFASIKVVTIIVFLIVGVLMIFGILGGKSPGLSNWVLSDASGKKGPFVGGISAIINVFLVAGFSFSGTEIVGLAAGESENPEENVPKAIKNVFWRILLFYMGAIIVIGFLVPFTDPNLLKSGADNISYSPFTMVFKRSGLAIAASIMNAVILTSVLSCGNSGLYVASRMLYSLSKEGKAPKFLSKVNKHGVPTTALYATTVIACFAFFASLIGDGKIYYILYNASGITAFFAWLGIAICHYRFRKAYTAQGKNLKDLKYRAKLYPFAPIISIILCIIVIFGSNIWVFQAKTFSWFDFVTNYLCIPIFISLYLGYKIIKKTKIVPLKECNFEYNEDNNKRKTLS
ncbi:amino acid permease [Clostridium ljungdahlii]|uniref:Lysine-specific permease n=1 Tax=Clostridium ljungdahlii TaxID=1538 RepID=A0A168M1A4_9CLOT|nr:amino acid permease [Clostridium ljungdahlii]OAA83974.1 Lysine-specific permease [Clostridium ljungdahlii]